MDFKPLILATVESAVFFGTSGPEIIRPEAADEQLERLIMRLNKLGSVERICFRRLLQRVIHSDEVHNAPKQYADFLWWLASTIFIALNPPPGTLSPTALT